MTQLQTYIAKTGTTQADIARAVGVSRAYMSQIASGGRTPRMKIAVAIEQFTKGAVQATSMLVPEQGAAL